MGTITERLKTNGKSSFTAQIRKKKKGVSLRRRKLAPSH